MSAQYIKLNMIPSGIMPVFNISQYDKGRELNVYVFLGSLPFNLNNYTVTIEATRNDGIAIVAAVATNSNVGTFEVTPTMSNIADRYRAQLVITNSNSKRIASLPFIINVVRACMDENAEAIEEDATLYQQYTDAMQSTIAEVRADLASEASTRESADNALNTRIDQIVAPSGGTPSAAEVTDARVGADGTVYNTLGVAIRTQVGNLDSRLYKGLKLTATTEIGGFNNTSIYDYKERTDRLRIHEVFRVSDIVSPIKVINNLNANVEVHTVYYDENGLFTKNPGVTSSKSIWYLDIDQNETYVAFVILSGSYPVFSTADTNNFKLEICAQDIGDRVKDNTDNLVDLNNAFKGIKLTATTEIGGFNNTRIYDYRERTDRLRIHEVFKISDIVSPIKVVNNLGSPVRIYTIYYDENGLFTKNPNAYSNEPTWYLDIDQSETYVAFVIANSNYSTYTEEDTQKFSLQIYSNDVGDRIEKNAEDIAELNTRIGPLDYIPEWYQGTVTVTGYINNANTMRVRTDYLYLNYLNAVHINRQSVNYQVMVAFFDENYTWVESTSWLDVSSVDLNEYKSVNRYYAMVVLRNGEGTSELLPTDIGDAAKIVYSPLSPQDTENIVDIEVREEIAVEATARENADNALSERIDNIIAPSGGAPSAAEVTDARVGADGTIYNSLGVAIRTQFDNVDSRIGQLLYIPSWKQGTVSSNGAINDEQTKRVRTDYLYFNCLHAVHIDRTTTNYQIMLAFFDSDYAWIENTSWLDVSDVDLDSYKNATRIYVMLVLRIGVGNDDLLPSDITDDLKIAYFPLSPKDTIEVIKMTTPLTVPSQIRGSLCQISRIGWLPYSGKYPQQSIASYAEAYRNGCRIMLCDIRVTSDGKFVLWHDDDVSHYARTDNGETIVTTLISDSTLAELKELDFGVYKGASFTGTRILTLEELANWCALTNTCIMLETKVQLTVAQVQEICSILKKRGLGYNTIVADDESYLSTTLSAWMEYLPNAIQCVRGGSRNSTNAFAMAKQFVDAGVPTMISTTSFETIDTYGDTWLDYGIMLEYSEVQSKADLDQMIEDGYIPKISYIASSYVQINQYIADNYGLIN